MSVINAAAVVVAAVVVAAVVVAAVSAAVITALFANRFHLQSCSVPNTLQLFKSAPSAVAW